LPKTDTASKPFGSRGQDRRPNGNPLHLAWRALIQHCQALGFGEILQLKIQDGPPVKAEETRKKVKFI